MPEFVDTSPPGQCIFCRLIAGEIPASRVYEDDVTLAFLDLAQLNPGHALVTIKRHADTLLDLTPDEAAAAMRTAHRVAQGIRKAFDPPGLTLLQCNGVEGGQTVGHFHIHVVPRFADDGVGLVWPRKDPPREVMEATAARLRDALAVFA
nr:HIT family protein [Dechloromonas sp.]